MRRAGTTISCRAFALIALLIVSSAAPLAARDRPPPKLPLAQWWSVALDGHVSAGPVVGGSRVFLALESSGLIARDAADGHELWRQRKNVTAPMIASSELLFVTGGGAVEALHAATGTSAWVLPRVTTVAPLLVDRGVLFAVTDTEVIAARAATGEVIWRHPAGGVRLAPAVDGDRLYLGADDGRVLALDVRDGSMAWQEFFSGGVTAIAAYRGRLYVGAGDKLLHCLEDGKKPSRHWEWRLGALAAARMAVDDDRVYVAALDNVVRALDRDNGNQRWLAPLRQRPSSGVFVSGHVVFVPVPSGSQLALFYDGNGLPAGHLDLPGDAAPGLLPAIVDSPDGAIVYVVTGSLTNDWHLAKYAPAGDTALFPFAKLEPMVGLPYLTDPALTPIGKVLQLLILGDPLLQPFADVGWPIVLRDPPLVPLTVLPGLQLRPLSPTLPVRIGGRGPGG